MRRMMLIVGLAATVIVAGCQSGPNYRIGARKVSVETVPSGAKVTQFGPMTHQPILLGTTPLSDQPVSVLIGAKGKMSGRALERLITQVGVVAVKIEKDGYVTWEGNLATDEKETKTHQIALELKQE